VAPVADVGSDDIVRASLIGSCGIAIVGDSHPRAGSADPFRSRRSVVDLSPGWTLPTMTKSVPAGSRPRGDRMSTAHIGWSPGDQPLDEVTGTVI
jgi:hypothetical protein